MTTTTVSAIAFLFSLNLTRVENIFDHNDDAGGGELAGGGLLVRNAAGKDETVDIRPTIMSDIRVSRDDRRRDVERRRFTALLDDGSSQIDARKWSAELSSLTKDASATTTAGESVSLLRANASSSASSLSLLSWKQRKSNLRKGFSRPVTTKQLSERLADNSTGTTWMTSARLSNRRRQTYGVNRNVTIEDSQGASYYVTVVLVVFSLPVVMLLASGISRRHARLIEDRQTRKYLQEFQVVKERSSRDMYRGMKRAIVAKLSRGGSGSSSSAAGLPTISGQVGNNSHRSLGRAVLPLFAVALPALPEEDDWTPDSNTGLLMSATGSRRVSSSVEHVGSSNLGASCSIRPVSSTRNATLKSTPSHTGLISVKRGAQAESSFSGSDGRICRTGSGDFLSTAADADVDDYDDVDDDYIASSDVISQTTNERDHHSFAQTSPTFNNRFNLDCDDEHSTENWWETAHEFSSGRSMHQSTSVNGDDPAVLKSHGTSPLSLHRRNDLPQHTNEDPADIGASATVIVTGIPYTESKSPSGIPYAESPSGTYHAESPAPPANGPQQERINVEMTKRALWLMHRQRNSFPPMSSSGRY